MNTLTGTRAGADIYVIADEVFATIGTGRQITPFTSRPAGLTLDDSYRIIALLNRRYEAQKRTSREVADVQECELLDHWIGEPPT